MDPNNSPKPKSPFKITGERIALLIGGTLIGALAIVFTLKLATPIVKKACQSILQETETGEKDVRVASVEALVLKPGPISKRITTIGQLRANEFVTLHTEMQGRIKEIIFKEGTIVKKGDILIQFEDDELRAEVDKNEAEVEYRQVKFDRIQKPELKAYTRAHEYDQERGQLNMAKATLELAKARLAKATIIAPFEGKIGLINVSPGAFVDTQKELVTIVDFDPMKIDFKIPEIHIHDIGAGQTAEVKLDSFPNQIFHATVEAIDSRVDPQTHSIAVRATIPNEDGKLQTGLFGSVSVIIGVKNDALVVPESCLGREGDIEFVWVIVNGKAGRKRVLTGTKESGKAEVTAGLRVGEIVVTSGQLKLGEGTAVKISNMGGDEVEVTDQEETSDGSPSTKTTKSPSVDSQERSSDIKDFTSNEPESQDTQKGTEKDAVMSPKVDEATPKSEQQPTTTEAKIQEPAGETSPPSEEPAQIKMESKHSEIHELKPQENPPKDQRSFFDKARDYVVNIFKRS